MVVGDGTECSIRAEPVGEEELPLRGVETGMGGEACEEGFVGWNFWEEHVLLAVRAGTEKIGQATCTAVNLWRLTYLIKLGIGVRRFDHI